MWDFAMEYPGYFVFMVFWLGLCLVDCVKYLAKAITRQKINDMDGIINLRLGKKEKNEE